MFSFVYRSGCMPFLEHNCSFCCLDKGRRCAFLLQIPIHVLFIFIKLIPVTFDVTCCIFRCKDMVYGHYILFSWCTWWIRAVVSPSLQCYEVGNFFTIHQKIHSVFSLSILNFLWNWYSIFFSHVTGLRVHWNSVGSLCSTL